MLSRYWVEHGRSAGRQRSPQGLHLRRRLDVLKQGAAKYPDVMVPIVCDVTSEESLQFAVDQVAQDIGYVNLLIANSGIAGPTNHYNPSLSLPELRPQLLSASMEDFTQTLHVNVTGAWFTMASFLELLDAGNKHAVSGRTVLSVHRSLKG